MYNGENRDLLCYFYKNDPVPHLFHRYGAIVGNLQFVVFDVRIGKFAHLLCHHIGIVLAWSLASLLYEGVYLAFQESSVFAYLGFQYGSISRYACDINPVWCAEIAKAIGYEPALV